MKSFVNVTATAIVIGIIGFSVYAIFWGSEHVARIFEVLEVQQRIILLTGVAAVLVAALMLVAGLRSAAKISARAPLMARRLEVYCDLMARYGVLLGAGSNGGGADGSAENPIDALSLELTLIAGTDVIDANARLTSRVRAGDRRTEEIEQALAALVKAMRRELGHPRTLDESNIPWLALVRAPADGAGDAARFQGGTNG